MGCPEVSVGLVFKNKPPVLTSPNILGLAADFTCRSADKGAFWPRVTRDFSGKEEGEAEALISCPGAARQRSGACPAPLGCPFRSLCTAPAVLEQVEVPVQGGDVSSRPGVPRVWKLLGTWCQSPQVSGDITGCPDATNKRFLPLLSPQNAELGRREEVWRVPEGGVLRRGGAVRRQQLPQVLLPLQ